MQNLLFLTRASEDILAALPIFSALPSSTLLLLIIEKDARKYCFSPACGQL